MKLKFKISFSNKSDKIPQTLTKTSTWPKKKKPVWNKIIQTNFFFDVNVKVEICQKKTSKIKMNFETKYLEFLLVHKIQDSSLGKKNRVFSDCCF